MILDTVLAIFPVIVDCTFIPIKRHLSYAFNCGSKVQKLKNLVVDLTNERDGLKQSVDAARRQGDEICTNVQNWLVSADGAIEESGALFTGEELANQRCFLGFIPDLKKRYQLGKRAEKKALTVDAILKKGGFDPISYRPPLRQILAPPVYDNEMLDSRVTILEKVMGALMHPAVNRIGVYGMSGVGKTTLAKEVHGKAIRDKLFDVVVMTTVSETVDVRKIQGKIADVLGLKLEEESEDGRAYKLHDQLMKKKTILVILDDIWKKLEPMKVGIPLGDDHKGCKIFLTSRIKDILTQDMDTQQSFELGVLSEAEAWDLFVKLVGGEFTNQALYSVATEVAKKCAGLPVLIVAVARALKNKELQEWKFALQELSRVNNERSQEIAYAAMELSYKHLASDELKSFFLLCAQIAQSDIEIRQLQLYCMGLDLLSMKDTVEHARDRVHKLTSDLKASCLLMDSDWHGYVKMHDVVRDAALFIASKSLKSKSQHLFTFRDLGDSDKWPNRDFRHCSRISLPHCEIRELPERLECPELEFLVLGFGNTDSGYPPYMKISDLFFEGITKLKVLEFNGMDLWSLPPSLGHLTNLLTLCLDGCVLRDASVIGGLKRLEILTFRNALIEQLPREIAHLTCLRLLDLSNCDKLKVIPANVISRLSLLEELYMRESFCNWELQGLKNASLAELKYLSRLTTLEVDIPNARMLPKDIFSNKLERYDITIGEKSKMDWYRYWLEERIWLEEVDGSSKKIQLNKGFHLDHGIELLLKEAENLHLFDIKGIKSILYDMEGFPQLKHLYIENGDDIQCIIDSTSRFPDLNAFSILETLFLKNLVSLEKICHGQLTTGSFTKLKKLRVFGCHGLKSLFSFYMVRNLSQLEKMEILSCKNLEEIVIDQSGIGEDNIEVAEFSQLRSLTLDDLPALKSFCFKGVVLEDEVHNPRTVFDKMVSFPKLEVLEVRFIGEKKKLSEVSSNSSISSSMLDCQDLKYLFTSSFLKSLLGLKRLDISYYEFIEGIVLPDEEEMNKIVLSKLDYLKLNGNSNLKSLCDGHIIEFCSLTKLQIKNCPAPKTFTSNSPSPSLFDDKVVFPNLKDLSITEMDNFKNIFPASVAQNLSSLEKLRVHQCRGVEEIVAKAESAEEALTFVFPKLLSLSLKRLTEIRTFYPGIHSLEFPKLKNLKVHNCGNGPEFCSEFFNSRQTLREDQQPLYSNKKVFPSLEYFSLDGHILDTVLQCQLPNGFLSKLKSVHLQHIRQRSSRAVSEFLQRLSNLETLTVGDSSLQEFLVENDGAMRPIRKLNFYNLQFLKYVRKPRPQMDLILQYFQTMEIWRCHNLISLASSSVSFQNLTSLQVGFCKVLKHLVTPSAAKSMGQLVRIEIRFCDSLTEIVVGEQDGAKEEIEFSKLKTLQLINLQRLTSFCFGSDIAFKFPSLEVVTVEGCPNMRTFSAGVLSTPKLQRVHLTELQVDNRLLENDLNATIEHLYMEMDGFNSIWSKKLKLSKYPQLMEKWNTQLPFKFLGIFETLVVDKCEFFSKALSSKQLQFLKNLQMLIVEKCESLEKIFDLDGMNADEGHEKFIPHLRELHLTDLPQLRCIWNMAPQEILGFKCLSLLKIYNCCSLSNVFTLPMVLELVQLERIEIKRCGLLEEIINQAGEEEGARDKTIFPSLQSITLEYLPSLISFYSGNDVLKCPSLKKIQIIDCPKMETFSVKNYSGLVVEEDRESCKGYIDAPTVSIFSGKIAIQMLEELKMELKVVEEIWPEMFEAGFFRRLKAIDLVRFPGRCAIFPLDFLQRLPNLEKLVLSDSLVEEIFLDELTIQKENNPWSLAELKVLELSKLTKLIHIVEENSQQVRCLEYLATLKVSECYTLKILVPSSVSLQNLTNLEVSKCHGMMNLITSPAARSLVKLKRMRVEDCEVMQEIVASEGDGAVDEICFGKLKYLELRCLPCLTSFCFGYYTFNFPSLENVIVIECPKMKIFTQGILSTPKLWEIHLNDEYEWQWSGSLNKTIQDLFNVTDDEED